MGRDGELHSSMVGPTLDRGNQYMVNDPKMKIPVHNDVDLRSKSAVP